MAAPRHSNPHHLLHQEAPISLSGYLKSLDILSDSETGTQRPVQDDRDDRLRQLEEFVRASMDRSLCFSSQGAPEDHPKPLEGSKVTFKEYGDNREETFEFCLLKADAPHKMSILPKPSTILTLAKEREYEDNERQAALRSRKAREVAVDFAWVMEQSKSAFSSSDQKLLSFEFSEQHTTPAPTIFITSRQIPSKKVSGYLRSLSNPQPSPHNVKPSQGYRMIAVEHSCKQTPKRHRRRLRSVKPKRKKPV